jgi:hypothetical protein
VTVLMRRNTARGGHAGCMRAGDTRSLVCPDVEEQRRRDECRPEARRQLSHCGRVAIAELQHARLKRIQLGDKAEATIFTDIGGALTGNLVDRLYSCARCARRWQDSSSCRVLL